MILDDSTRIWKILNNSERLLTIVVLVLLVSSVSCKFKNHQIYLENIVIILHYFCLKKKPYLRKCLWLMKYFVQFFAREKHYFKRCQTYLLLCSFFEFSRQKKRLTWHLSIWKLVLMIFILVMTCSYFLSIFLR